MTKLKEKMGRWGLVQVYPSLPGTTQHETSPSPKSQLPQILQKMSLSGLQPAGRGEMAPVSSPQFLRPFSPFFSYKAVAPHHYFPTHYPYEEELGGCRSIVPSSLLWNVSPTHGLKAVNKHIILLHCYIYSFQQLISANIKFPKVVVVDG